MVDHYVSGPYRSPASLSKPRELKKRHSLKVPEFNGSSRGGANSQTLLAEAIRGVKVQGAEVTVYILDDANIRPYQNSCSCDRESRNARCDSDGLTGHRPVDRSILASPILFFIFCEAGSDVQE